MSPWIETYRGTAHAWEIDNVGHFTVAFYFDRLTDATLNLLRTLGLGADHVRREGRAGLTVDLYVRFQHELRVGDVMHFTSGVIGVESDGLTIGHKMFDSATDALCTTFEQRVVYAALPGRDPLPLPDATRRVAEAARLPWDGPTREVRPQPPGVDGFRVALRDTVKPWEIDVTGQSSLSHHVHRFSAANAQAIAAFGMTPAYQRDQHRGFSTFEFQFAQTGSLQPGDPVCVRTGLMHVGSSSVRVLHRMFNGATGDQVASLEQFGVHLDMDARRPAALPDALREKARALLVPPAPAA